jgi:hypothetical protein
MRDEKHVFGASAGIRGTGQHMTVSRYQRMRALKHGGYSERTVPRSLGLRSRLR